jgi:3'(2'), 5'-bisphosphate nucleotidase
VRAGGVSAAAALDAELEAARALARAAGAAAMRHYGAVTAHAKAGGSPVTAADHAANAVIVAGLRARFPGDAILSEESADTAERLGARRVWIVDPLDGTKEFLAGNGEFSVMIGLAVDGEPVVGAVYRPDGDVLFSAARDRGAWVERHGERRPLRRGPADLAALRLVGSRSHPDPRVVELQAALGIAAVRPCGSVGLKCALIAEGESDLYVHPVPYLKEWDTCAPEILLREAGGEVVDCRGERLRYNKPDPTQPHGLVACAPGVLEAARRHLIPVTPARPTGMASSRA